MGSIEAPLGWNPGCDDPWTRRMREVLCALLDAAPGSFLVGYATQLMANDLLVRLRGTREFMLDMAVDLAACGRRLEQLLELWTEAFEGLRAVVDASQPGAVWSWPGLIRITSFLTVKSRHSPLYRYWPGWSLSTVSTKRSCTSAPVTVAPQLSLRVWPITM